MDCFIEIHMSGDTGPAVVYIEVQYAGGGWEHIGEVPLDTHNKSAFPVILRYTTLGSNWTSFSLRARTVNNRTLGLSLRVEIDNGSESGYVPHSMSNLNTYGDVGGTPPPGGGGGGDDGGYRPPQPLL